MKDKELTRKPWETPVLSRQGHLAEVVQKGGGKLTPSPKDPGEPRKVPSQEP